MLITLNDAEFATLKALVHKGIFNRFAHDSVERAEIDAVVAKIEKADDLFVALDLDRSAIAAELNTGFEEAGCEEFADDGCDPRLSFDFCVEFARRWGEQVSIYSCDADCDGDAWQEFIAAEIERIGGDRANG